MSITSNPPAYLMYSTKGNPKGQVPITGDSFLIGRSDGSDLQILDPQVSRRHILIQRQADGKFVLRDEGSKSGTFVNKQRVVEHTLTNGDEIILGDSTIAVIRFHSVEAAPVNPLANTVPIQQIRSGGMPAAISLSGTLPLEAKTTHKPAEASPSVEMRINDRQTRFLNLELLREQLKRPEGTKVDQTVQRLSKLYEITHTLLPAKSVQELVDKWLEAIFTCLPCERGAILLHNSETGEFEQVVARDRETGKCGQIHTSFTIIEQTFRENVAVLCRDATSDERFASQKSIVIQNLRSVLCAPISSNLRVWGVCYLYNTKAIAQFNGEDLEFLMATAREAGLVFENLQLVGHLEALVTERTAEIVRQAEEIQHKNNHIMDSIRYAERIQQAILPHDHRVSQLFPEHFILFRPKDIVSGDFYWVNEIDGVVIAAVADCTGHGVPGALMSMIGNTLLNQIVNEKRILDPALILEHLHNGIREALRQEHAESESQDGMDLCLCRIEPGRVVYAGSRRPLYVVTRQPDQPELIEIKGDRKSIGGMQKEDKRVFTNHEFQVTEPVMLYLSSDGFADQPSEQGQKFSTRRFREFLTHLARHSAERQYELIVAELEAHQGNEVQRDDLTVVGICVG